MYRVFNILIILLIITFFVSGCAETAIKTKADPVSVAEQVAKFSPVVIQYDHNLLDENETQALREIVRAAKLMDEIFLDQVYSRNEAIQRQLLVLSDNSYQTLFNIMFGPFDRLEGDKPFINSISKPTGANYYPEDMSKEEFNRWVNEHPEDKDSFEDVFTLIRRKGHKLVAVGLLKKSFMFDKIMCMEQAMNSTIKSINGMEA